MGDVTPIDKAKWVTLAALMHQLQEAPGWQAYRDQMEQLELQAVESLITDPTLHRAGFVQGLRAAYHLPSRIIDKVKDLT